MSLDVSSRVELSNGILMPWLGLGCFRLESGDVSGAINAALEAGYRSFDTAMIYGNEREVGAALNDSGVSREELFVTTKLWHTDHGYEETHTAFDVSLKNLGLEYVDLYLVHWPEGDRKETWRAMEELLASGKTKAIGVSNYTIKHLEEMRDYTTILPAVNQVEFHPLLYQKELLEYCKKNNIVLEAYRSILKGENLDDEKFVEIAGRYNKTVPQILLRWALQHEVIVIPKSSHKERITENSRLFDFELSSEDMNLLDSFNKNYRTGWDPGEVD